MPRVAKTNTDGQAVFITDNVPLPIEDKTLAKAAFGDLAVAQETPLVQLKFPYGVNSRVAQNSISNASGSVTSEAGMAVCSTGASASSITEISSRVPAEYQPGIGIVTKFTSLYSTPAMGSEQLHGIGTPADGFFFGYENTTFGVHAHSGGAQHVEDFVITDAATASDDITITLDGDSKTVAITNGDTEWDIARKIAATSNFSTTGDGWRIFLVGTTISFRSFTAEPRTGTFSYNAGTTGSTATVETALEGVVPIDVGVAQADWNIDTMIEGNPLNPSGMVLNHTKLNVYKIQYQFLGAGAIEFFIESDTTGEFVKVHRVNYTGNNIVPSVRNPTLPLYISVKNTTNTTDIIMKTGSMCAFSQGKVNESGIVFGVSGAQPTVTTEEVIFGMHLPPVYNGISSRVIAKPLTLTLDADGTKSTTFRIYRDPLFNNSPVFTELAPGESPMHVTSTAGTTVTGIVVASFTVSKVASIIIDMTVLDIEGVTGSGFAVTAQSANTTIAKADLTYKSFQ